MNPTPTVISLASVLLAFAGTTPCTGQSDALDPPGRPPHLADHSRGGTMVYEREVFLYPGGERRNPFLPVADLSAGDPAVEDARLLGILHHPDVAYSLVVLHFPGEFGRTRGIPDSATGSQPGGTTARLRTGGAFGDVRIVRIHEDRVVIETDRPDGAGAKVIAIPRLGPGR